MVGCEEVMGNRKVGETRRGGERESESRRAGEQESKNLGELGGRRRRDRHGDARIVGGCGGAVSGGWG